MPIHRAAGLALLTAFLLGPGSARPESPIVIEDESLEIGKVVAGSTVSATFVLHNRSPNPVRILRAAPS